MDSDNIKELERLTQCTKTASKCVVCGKDLGDDAIYYINGDAFCSQSCRDISDYRDKYGAKIDKTISEYIRPIYADSDAALLANRFNNVEKVLGWNPVKKSPNGLIVHGKTGCGKTRCVSLLLKRLIPEKLYGIERSLKVFYAGELERAILSAFGGNKTSYSTLIEQICAAKLLVIDDFGKERFTERFETSVFNIFECRISRCLPTIITTNYVGETLKSRFCDMDNFAPFYRRLIEFNEAVCLSPRKDLK